MFVCWCSIITNMRIMYTCIHDTISDINSVFDWKWNFFLRVKLLFVAYQLLSKCISFVHYVDIKDCHVRSEVGFVKETDPCHFCACAEVSACAEVTRSRSGSGYGSGTDHWRPSVTVAYCGCACLGFRYLMECCYSIVSSFGFTSFFAGH